MLKPICVPCRRFFHCVKTGFYFTEGMPESGAKPGLEEPEKWQPYKLWSGDKWRCEGCGAEIISGTGRDAIAVQHEPDFSAYAERIGATQFQVNDC